MPEAPSPIATRVQPTAIAPINRTRVIKLMESNPWSGSPGPRRCRASPCSGARALPSPVRGRQPRRAGQSPRVRIGGAFVRTRCPGHDPEATPSASIGWRMPCRSGSSRPVRRCADGPSQGVREPRGPRIASRSLGEPSGSGESPPARKWGESSRPCPNRQADPVHSRSVASGSTQLPGQKTRLALAPVLDSRG